MCLQKNIRSKEVCMCDLPRFCFQLFAMISQELSYLRNVWRPTINTATRNFKKNTFSVACRNGVVASAIHAQQLYMTNQWQAHIECSALLFPSRGLILEEFTCDQYHLMTATGKGIAVAGSVFYPPLLLFQNSNGRFPRVSATHLRSPISLFPVVLSLNTLDGKRK